MTLLLLSLSLPAQADVSSGAIISGTDDNTSCTTNMFSVQKQGIQVTALSGGLCSESWTRSLEIEIGFPPSASYSCTEGGSSRCVPQSACDAADGIGEGIQRIRDWF